MRNKTSGSSSEKNFFYARHLPKRLPARRWYAGGIMVLLKIELGRNMYGEMNDSEQSGLACTVS